MTLVRTLGVGYALGADGALPKKMLVLKWGDNPNAHGIRVHVGDKLVQALAHPTYPWHKVALDFEHNTLPGTAAYVESQEPRAVAGFGVISVEPGVGVLLSVERYTPDGIKHASNYCDLSGSPVLDDEGEVIGIHSVALCKNGAVPDMDFREVALSVEAPFADFVSTNTTQKKDTQMEKLKAFIAKLLGKDPATVTEDELLSGLEVKIAEVKPDAMPAAALAALVTAAVTPLSTRMEELGKRFEALSAESLATHKQAIVDEALRGGKHVALSAEAIEAMTPKMLTDHVAALAVTIPVTQRTPSVEPLSASDDGITEMQRTIALNCGMDPVKVFGKAKKEGGFTRLSMVICCALVIGLAALVTLAAPFNAPEKMGTAAKVTAGAEIHAGWLVCMWTNGLAYPAADKASYVVLGRAEDNAAIGEALVVKGGVFRYANRGVFAAKDIGTVAYLWTNTAYSVGTAAVASADIKAGTIVDVDAKGVWIDTRRK